MSGERAMPWLVQFACGHSSSFAGAPKNGWRGAWITCSDGKCQGQRRVMAAERQPQPMVQGLLFEADELAGLA